LSKQNRNGSNYGKQRRKNGSGKQRSSNIVRRSDDGQHNH
jgi:hypothetical protein